MLAVIYYILILGIVIFIHEFGHFIMAKKAGVYCYEFSLGMGPKLWSFKRKNDETEYSLRLFPVGGYVQMAGEEIEKDENIPDKKRMQSKTVWQRLKIVLAGVFNNFILGLVLLLLYSFIFGSYEYKPYVGTLDSNYNAYKVLEKGDLITKIGNKKVYTSDDVVLDLMLVDKGSTQDITVLRDGKEVTVSIEPICDEESDSCLYGISLSTEKTYGFMNKVKYALSKFVSIFKTIIKVVINLFTGRISMDTLSGPVGIFSTVKEYSKTGIKNIVYLTAYISINVGIINLIPFPAFDGYRAFCLILEKIRKKQLDPKVDNIINTIGLAILLILIAYISVKDIIKLF